MKKHPLALLMLLSFAACSTPPVEDPEVGGENEVIEHQTDENLYSQTVDFLDKAESLSTVEVVENNRAAYEDPEHAKLELHMWKTGTFKTTDYAGQSLVLVQQDCEGPCSPVYFRYAVDEATDTWTLLTNYSSDAQATNAGPQDKADAKVSIPELNVPESLEGYTNDSVALLDSQSRLDASRFPADDQAISSMDGITPMNVFQDPSFPAYYMAGGCLYGVAPDGLMARYTVLPNMFTVDELSGKELTFVSKDGQTQKESFALSAGGCGLAWSCLSTFELSTAEESSLEERGTLNDRTVYLPKTVGERPELTADPSLDQRLYSAFDNHVMAQAYASGQDPMTFKETNTETIQDFLDSNSVFLLKLDGGSYTLVTKAGDAPAAECGKPVIYLYPEKNTLVRVQVGIEEFTKTIPAYGPKGWTVLARASGLLTNMVDKMNYPYLFWEGTSSKNLEASSTWTLAKADVATELPKALLGMGLNEKETQDFMEFWQPKLEAVSEPFVEFSFVGNKAMDEIAPLTIVPAPDQVIRIFMLYRGVAQSGLEMPTYTPAVRTGFTAIEWGGTLY